MYNAQLSVLGRQGSATATILVIDEQLLLSSALAHTLRCVAPTAPWRVGGPSVWLGYTPTRQQATI